MAHRDSSGAAGEAGEARGECERPGGVRGVADGVQGDERKQEVAEQGGGGARGGVAVSVLLAGRKTTGGEWRWAGPCCWSRWATR